MAAIARISARAVSGVMFRSCTRPDGMILGPLITPFSM
jgi:hypothetical protein